MNRRQFFGLARKVALGALVASVLPESNQPVITGVDVATEGTDTTGVSLYATTATGLDNLGGFLVPQEYAHEVLYEINNIEGGRNSFSNGLCRTVRYQPSTVPFPTDMNLLKARREFAQFLREDVA